jgi:putative ABC transport system permease protein
VVARRIEQDHPDENTAVGVNVSPIAGEDVGPGTRRYVWILQGAVAFVLLIACANLANLLLARSMGRRREMAVRLALGATRFRLARQMLCESLLLSLAGGALGLILAVWGISGIMAMAPDAPHLNELRLDLSALGFTLISAVVTGLIFGLAPALDAARRNVNDALSQGGRSGSGGVPRRLRTFLVAGEVALALVLLVGAGLLIRTVRGMIASDAGFRIDGLLTLRLPLPETKYPKEEQIGAFGRAMLEKAVAVAGVESASLASGLPMQGLRFSSYSVEGASPAADAKRPTADVRSVSEDYFRTMVIPMLRGRSFTRQEVEDSKSGVSVVSEMFVRETWPGEDPLGKAIRVEDQRRVVIGVASNVRQLGPDTPTSPEIYLPSERSRLMTLVVRTQKNPKNAAGAISRLIWSIDKDQPIDQIHTMEESLGEWVSERRFAMLLLAVFAALALGLAAVGMYGVLAYSVSQRTREIGIRMALGADGRGILKLIAGEGLKLAGIGAVIGLAGALALTRLMQGLLFGVTATDPGTFLAGAAVLIVVSVLAVCIPARRASKLAPLEALRQE